MPRQRTGIGRQKLRDPPSTRDMPERFCVGVRFAVSNVYALTLAVCERVNDLGI